MNYQNDNEEKQIKRESTQFIPGNITYAVVSQESKKLGGLFLSVGCLLFTSIISFSIFNTNRYINFFGSGFFLTIALLVSLYLSSFIFRLLCLHERTLLKLHKEKEVHRSTTVDDLCEIQSIPADDSDDPRIVYTDGSQKLLIKCLRGHTIGRTPEFEVQQISTMTEFIKDICMNYELDYYSWHENSINDKLFSNLASNVMQTKNANLREYGNALLTQARRQESGIQSYIVDYFLISTSDRFLMSTIVDDVTNSLSILASSLFTEAHICKGAEISNWVETIMRIEGINFRDILLHKSSLSGEANQSLFTILTYTYDDDFDAESSIEEPVLHNDIVEDKDDLSDEALEILSQIKASLEETPVVSDKYNKKQTVRNIVYDVLSINRDKKNKVSSSNKTAQNGVKDEKGEKEENDYNPYADDDTF